MQLQLLPERPCLPVNMATRLAVLVRLVAPTVPQMARKPLNLCLVIDRSGSMAGRKLRQTIASAKYVVERLAPTDLFSVVQFDERVKVVIPPRPVADRAQLCRLLDTVREGGATNLSGGWLQGAACVRKSKTPETVNRVILLTDGIANHGIVDPAVLAKHAAELTEEGIATTTLGYGADFNEDLLTALADAGRGTAYHVETADEAPAVFARELEGLLTIAAQNVRLTICPGRAGCAAHLLTDQDHQQNPEGLTVALGDLVSAEERRLLLSAHVPALGSEGLALLAAVTLTYDSVGGEIRPREVRQELLIRAVSPEQAITVPADPAVTRELLMLRAARILRQAMAEADTGDTSGALQCLREFLACPNVRQTSDPEVRAARQRVKEVLHQLEQEGYTPMSRKQMSYSSYRWSRSKGRPSEEA